MLATSNYRDNYVPGIWCEPIYQAAVADVIEQNARIMRQTAAITSTDNLINKLTGCITGPTLTDTARGEEKLRLSQSHSIINIINHVATAIQSLGTKLR